MADYVGAEHGLSRSARFAATKFRPTTLPTTLIARPALHERLTAGGGKRLTVVVGSAGVGKSVLLSSWAAARPAGTTAWLACDEADSDPVRFWEAFIETPRNVQPTFGCDAAELLAMDGTVSADVTAAIANDAGKLPPGSAIVLDDFQTVAPTVSRAMTDLVERWPAETAQLVLSSRIDPPLRLHRLRMLDELCELRDRDLCFMVGESRGLLANFGVELTTADLALLHQRSEGWAAALQMIALSLRGNHDPTRIKRAIDLQSHAIAEYFIAEVLDQQPPELVRFMLDTSVLGELTAEACTAVTGSEDAAVLLRRIAAASLFLVPLDDERTSFRYHHLVQSVLRAELRARDRAHEQSVELKAGEWLESAGNTRRAAHHFLAGRQTARALALMNDGVVTDFLADPAPPPALDLSTITPALIADGPDRLLPLAAELLMSGDTARGGEYLDQIEYARPSIPPGSQLAARVATMRSVRHALMGRAADTVAEALAARTIQKRTQQADDWVTALPVILLRAYTWLEDFEAVEREAATALEAPTLTKPVKLVQVRGAQALAWFEAGHLVEAAQAAAAAEADAKRLGFAEHYFAVDYLRVLAGLALERRDLDCAERLATQALSISEHGRPAFEFLALLDWAQIRAARGDLRESLATVDTARLVLSGSTSELIVRADEFEAMLRLSAGEVRTPLALAGKLPPTPRALLLASIALASGDHAAAQHLLQAPELRNVRPRRALARRILLAAAMAERGDPKTHGIVADLVETARHAGYLNTVVTTAPQVTSYLIEHSSQTRSDGYIAALVDAALQVRAMKPDIPVPRHEIVDAPSAAELRVLKLLPTSTYLEIAETLCISRNTVKSHVRAIYQKLGVASRSEAIERAVALRLL